MCSSPSSVDNGRRPTRPGTNRTLPHGRLPQFTRPTQVRSGASHFLATHLTQPWDGRYQEREEQADAHSPGDDEGVEQGQGDGAEGEDGGPQVDQQYRAALGVADLQEAVVQVHLVRVERAESLAGT